MVWMVFRNEERWPAYSCAIDTDYSCALWSQTQGSTCALHVKEASRSCSHLLLASLPGYQVTRLSSEPGTAKRTWAFQSALLPAHLFYGGLLGRGSIHVHGDGEGSKATLIAWLKRRAAHDYGHAVVGKPVWICWCADAQFYRGTITHFNPDTGKHQVRAPTSTT